MKISCWTLFIMLSFCGAKIVFFTVKQTKFQLVFKEVPYSWQWRASFFPLFADKGIGDAATLRCFPPEEAWKCHN